MFKKSIILKLLFISSPIITLASQHVDVTRNSIIDSTQAQELARELDAYMQALTKLDRFSGSIVVSKGNTVLLNKGYGFAHHEFDIPNTPHTKFMICSITKMVTASAIMYLQERGLLRVNDPINKYLSDYSNGNEITIHHLLSHTSGISSCNFPLEMIVLPTSLEQMVSFIKNQSLEFEPGTDYNYSNAGYSILSYIIEKVSGTSYESFIKETILEPLTMNESLFSDYDYAVLKNCASGYCFNAANNLVNGHYVYAPNGKGGGGLYCTAHDLYKFAWALSTGVLVNKESLRSMFTPYHNKENYGYGCRIHDLLGHKLIEHGGMLSSGFKSNLSMFIDDGIVIAILSNRFSSWVNEARDALAAITFGCPYDFPSCNLIKIDSALYDDYQGVYDHPSFKLNYKVERGEDRLYIPENGELAPVAIDQFILVNRKADNIVYKFIRDEKGYVTQLRIKGGAPYFEVRCDKIK